jgi:hypothetical protein
VAEEVVYNLISEGVGAATCAHDGDGPGAEEWVQRRHWVGLGGADGVVPWDPTL